MPRANRISLTAGGLAMPAVDHLSNKGTHNLLLDRALSGVPAGLPPDRTMIGLFTNFSRLTDENCVSAVHRAVLNAQALRASKIGRAAPRLTPRQKDQLAYARNAIEHSDEKLLGKQHGKSPVFGKVDPYSLRLANTCMVIGANVLTYKDLVSAMTKCHKTIEVIRGVPTGSPGPAFPNTRLRTDPGVPAVVPGTMMASSYLKELNRLQVTHS
jgi:hypothetical protein